MTATAGPARAATPTATEGATGPAPTPHTGRTLSQAVRLGNQARLAAAASDRWGRRAAAAAERTELAREQLAAIHRKTCERFGRNLPEDALLLDVLDSIDIEPGDRWIWHGHRNNKGLAVVRTHPSRSNQREWSLVRYLAIELGVIGPDDHGILYPKAGDVDDVNPWRRTLRRSDHPPGNPSRYGATGPDQVAR